MPDLNLSSAYVAIRDDIGGGIPDIPASWGEYSDPMDGWLAGHFPDGDLWALLIVNVVGGRVLCAVWGPTARLDAIASGRNDVMPGREAWRRGLVGDEASTRNILRAWRWYRCSGLEAIDDGINAPSNAAFSGVRELSSEGVLLPRFDTNPLPWLLDADGNVVAAPQAVIRVDSISRPALPLTLAGFSCGTILEDEPDRG